MMEYFHGDEEHEAALAWELMEERWNAECDDDGLTY